MENFINRFNMNPFTMQAQGINAQPIRPSANQEPAIGFAANPFTKASFGHLAGVSKNGPGSLLRTAPGETGLGDKAILTQNGELGRKLFINI